MDRGPVIKYGVLPPRREQEIVIKYGITPPWAPPQKEDSDSLGELAERVIGLKKIVTDYMDFLARVSKTVLSPEINTEDTNEFITELEVNLKLLKTRLNVIERKKRIDNGNDVDVVVAEYAVIAPRQ